MVANSGGSVAAVRPSHPSCTHQTQARGNYFSTGGQGQKISLAHGPPILKQGPRDVAELTTGHIINVAPYMNAGPWSLMQTCSTCVRTRVQFWRTRTCTFEKSSPLST